VEACWNLSDVASDEWWAQYDAPEHLSYPYCNRKPGVPNFTVRSHDIDYMPPYHPLASMNLEQSQNFKQVTWPKPHPFWVNYWSEHRYIACITNLYTTFEMYSFIHWKEIEGCQIAKLSHGPDCDPFGVIFVILWPVLSPCTKCEMSDSFTYSRKYGGVQERGQVTFLCGMFLMHREELDIVSLCRKFEMPCFIHLSRVHTGPWKSLIFLGSLWMGGMLDKMFVA